VDKFQGEKLSSSQGLFTEVEAIGVVAGPR